MFRLTPALFSVLNDPKAEAVLFKLYKAALKQGFSVVMRLLPRAHRILSSKGDSWKGVNESFYEDKYIPIHPAQGDFLYMQARAIGAKNIFEFGTSYGISTIYLGLAAKANGGKVISTEYISHKVKAARQHIAEAGLSDHVTILEGNARETLKTVDTRFDMALLDGFPDMVFDIFRQIEPQLSKGAVIAVDDVQGFKGAMLPYLNYVRNPANGYVSTTLHLKKGLEFTLKTR